MRNSRKNFRFAFVVPPTGKYRRDDRCQSAVDSQTAIVVLPPVDMARYAAIIRQYGHNARIFDFQIASSLEQTWKMLIDFKPHFILVPVSCPTEKDDFEFIEKVKSCLDVKVFVKGGRSPWEYRALFERYPTVDYIMIGEIERTLEKFLEKEGRIDPSIPALAWKSQHAVKVNSESSIESNISRFPLPARDLLENDKYINPATRKPMTVIQAHRGCPGNCVFCPAPLVEGKKVRFRSIDNIMKEINECVEEYHIRDFLFDGDTFTINKRWVLDLCRALKESELDIQWACNSRVDTIDEDMAREMKKAGCWIVGFGIESGSDKLLEKMGKQTTTEQARKAVKICKEHGLKVHTFYIIGLPWETEQTLRETLRFAREVKADFFDINLAAPLPGTPFYKMVSENNLYEPDAVHHHSYSNSTIRSFALDNQTLRKWRKKMLLSLTFSPSFLFKSMRFALQQGQLSYYAAYAIKRMKNITGQQS